MNAFILRLQVVKNIFIAGLLGCAAGCASLGTYNPATGRNELILISTPAEVSMGQDIHAQLKQEFQLSQDAGKVARLNRIGQRVAQVSDRQDYQYHFYLIEKDELNAFTVPGGSIYMFTGLMDRLNSDDEIGAVLAHEAGHCAARHTIKKFQAGMGYNIIGNLLLSRVQLENQAKQLIAQSSGALMQLVFSAYGRSDEFEADKLGVKYMHLAGYDLQAIIKTFELLDQKSKGADVPLILRSHPYIKDRITRVREEIQKIKTNNP